MISVVLEHGDSLLEVAEKDSVLEGNGSGRIEHGLKDSVETDFQSLTDGEMEEDVRMLEVPNDVLEDEKMLDGEEGKYKMIEDGTRRQGTRKKPFKLTVGTGASNKLKMAQMMNAKRIAAKPGNRHGDSSEQAEDKGTSNPKYEPAKK